MDINRRLVVPAAGALALLAGFAVASATGNRHLGGAILVAGGAGCVAAWWRRPGPGRALAGVAVFALAFVAAHPLGHVIGAWPSVLLMSAAAASAAWRLGAGAASMEVDADHPGPAPDGTRPEYSLRSLSDRGTGAQEPT